MSDHDSCAICFEGITAQTGKTVLGCGHAFHMLCVVRWFQGQEGPSSCPYCRHEAGELDNVPMAEDDEDDDGSDTDSYDSDDDEIEVVWFRAADGTWIRHWRESTPQQWKPTSAEPAPEDLTLTATWIQSLWRGHTVRTDMGAATALLALKTAAPEPLPTK